jgi:hypothetical protein
MLLELFTVNGDAEVWGTGKFNFFSRLNLGLKLYLSRALT